MVSSVHHSSPHHAILPEQLSKPQENDLETGLDLDEPADSGFRVIHLSYCFSADQVKEANQTVTDLFWPDS